jgi:Arm DNA-binding domain
VLTALAIEKLKPKEKPYRVSDGNQLSVLVEPAGAKLWRLRYIFDGKEKMLSLGSFPEVSLADARRKRDEALALLANGINPSEQKKQDKLVEEAARRNTFGAVAEEYLERLVASGVTEGTVKRNRWLLLGLSAPLAKRPIAKITPIEILVLLQKYEKAGLRVTAKRQRGIIGAVFRLAIATLRAPTDPTYALRGAIATPVVTHRPAITDERQLGALLAKVDEYAGWPTLKAALQFLALTMARPIEADAERQVRVVGRKLWTVLQVGHMKKLWQTTASCISQYDTSRSYRHARTGQEAGRLHEATPR